MAQCAGTLHAFAFWWQLGLHDDNTTCENNATKKPTGAAVAKEITAGSLPASVSGEGLVLDTGPHGRHLKDGGSSMREGRGCPQGNAGRHWRQAAAAIKPPRSISVGEVLTVDVSMGVGVNGGIEIRLVEEGSA